MALLKHYVKALADIVNGRPNKLSPADLANPCAPIEEVQPQIDEMTATRQAYRDNRRRKKNGRWGPPRVTIPVPKPGGNNFRVLKIHFNVDTTDGVIPDPSSLLGKSGINWSFRCGEKPVSHLSPSRERVALAY